MTTTSFSSVALRLVSLAFPIAQAPAPSGTIVASNMNAESVSIVDVASGSTIATIPTGEGPHEVAISHDGRWAVDSIYGNRSEVDSSLLVIDLATPAATRTPPISQP